MALVASRGLLNDCVNFADGSFAALLQSCGEGDSTMETVTHLLCCRAGADQEILTVIFIIDCVGGNLYCRIVTSLLGNTSTVRRQLSHCHCFVKIVIHLAAKMFLKIFAWFSSYLAQKHYLFPIFLHPFIIFYSWFWIKLQFPTPGLGPRHQCTGAIIADMIKVDFCAHQSSFNKL